jgi:hypothetical protein
MLFAVVSSTCGYMSLAAGPLPPRDRHLCTLRRPAALAELGGQKSCAHRAAAAAGCRQSAEQHTPPVLTSLTLPTEPVPVGAWAGISAGFRASPGVQHSATIAWGDGSTTELSEASSPVSASHRYAAGVYTVAVTVRNDEQTDSRCSSAEQTSYVVVYDPATRYVTGSGWLQSEPGWCTFGGCTAASGIARFGFVFRYQRGASAPMGAAQLQFQDGGFRFRSMTHDWLAVSDGRAQFRGSGWVNDVAGYEFLLMVQDGEPAGQSDRIRIKVWAKATGKVVYDSEPAAIRGGSITIRT